MLRLHQWVIFKSHSISNIWDLASIYWTVRTHCIGLLMEQMGREMPGGYAGHEWEVASSRGARQPGCRPWGRWAPTAVLQQASAWGLLACPAARWRSPTTGQPPILVPLRMLGPASALRPCPIPQAACTPAAFALFPRATPTGPPRQACPCPGPISWDDHILIARSPLSCAATSLRCLLCRALLLQHCSRT